VSNALENDSIDGATLLHEMTAFVRRYVFLSKAQAEVVPLWIAHTYAFDAADATPYLAVNSAEKESGKTRFLEVCDTLVGNPWMTGKVSAAVLYRKIDKERPTLLLDESDAAFGGQKEYAEALRGILNTGHRRGGKASCCVGQGANITYQDFSTFCPKAIAGIGRLPDTVAGRSIQIRLKRAAPGERMERFRQRDVENEATRLREQLRAWILPLIDGLRAARPWLPEELTDRQQDGAEPLLAIADAAGGEWPRAARQALVELHRETVVSEESTGLILLRDVAQIFDEKKIARISSFELAHFLAQNETGPWGEWNRGKPISQWNLARLLKPFGIAPHNVRMAGKTPKGYDYEDFQDSFHRYLRTKNSSAALDGPHTATAATENKPNELGVISKRHGGLAVADQKRETANNGADCGAVAVSRPLPQPGAPKPILESGQAAKSQERALSGDDAERFGQPHARLFPFILKIVMTPYGAGRLETVYESGCEVLLDCDPERLVVFRYEEIVPVFVGSPDVEDK
jgi:hypothetical protein